MTSGDEIVFGPFVLAPRKRLLSSEGAPVELGTRALDILIALISRSNRSISKKDLLPRMARRHCGGKQPAVSYGRPAQSA